MGDNKNKTLFVRHLPAELSATDCDDLLKHFGARHIRYMGNTGRMKNSAFATFDSCDAASTALRRLHQLEILGTTLIVEFSKNRWEDLHPSELDDVVYKPTEDANVPSSTQQQRPTYDEQKRMEKEKKVKIAQKINSMSSKWNVEYPLNPNLQYMYPAPTITILTNIANALATVPRFYVQVLHLMNKMNLPAPFGARTLTPPIPVGKAPPMPPEIPDHPPEPDELDEEDMIFSSEAESELESDTEGTDVLAKAKKLTNPSEVGVANKRTRRKDKRSSGFSKRLKLQIMMQAQLQSVTGMLPSAVPRPPNTHDDVFERTEHMAPKRIELKLPTEATETAQLAGADTESEKVIPTLVPVVEEGGFGRIEPERKTDNNDDDNEEEELGETEFVSSRQLRKGRISRAEMQELSVFKNYETGEPSSRLYIKNLAKQVTEKDLHCIYGRYVDWSSESERSIFYKQLMNSGRMKGQAFITLPSEDKTKEALADTNGYVLHGKPMVVSFARSAKPKEKADLSVANK